MEFYIVLIAVFIVGFLSSLLGNYIGEKRFGDKASEVTLNMTFHVDGSDIDVDEIADEIADEFEKTQKYMERRE